MSMTPKALVAVGAAGVLAGAFVTTERPEPTPRRGAGCEVKVDLATRQVTAFTKDFSTLDAGVLGRDQRASLVELAQEFRTAKVFSLATLQQLVGCDTAPARAELRTLGERILVSQSKLGAQP